jgi:ferredoxin
MSVKRVGQAALHAWVDGLIRQVKVIGVQAKDDKFDFAPLSKASDLRLDYDVTLAAPGRAALLPAEDVLVRFQGLRFESVLAGEPFVLLGVHPYDMVAINQMDEIFTQVNCDCHYTARRNAATIVACDVQKPSANVFAGALGYAVVDKGFDVLLTKIDKENYLVDARGEKGQALTASLADAPEADKKSLAARKAVWKRNEKRLRKHDLKVAPSELASLLDRSYDHPVWEEKSRLCFSCGSCTNVCPTCYCFDVQDDVDWDLQGGRRKRCWDGCQLTAFARVAGGHNFRKDRAARYRHRYYRKGKWAAAKVGQVACVGCGRCISVCVSKIAHPPEVYNRLLEVK